MKNILTALPELVANGVISLDTARQIEAYYAGKKEPQGNNLLTVFGILGAVLSGLGIILIFAHNWDTFAKSTKTAVALLPLVVFQALAGYTLIKKKNAAWRESAGVLLFFAVGASMALIAQIYNIPGDLGSYLCTWALLCLPLMYLLRSKALALLHIVFATYYACEATLGNDGRPWMYLLFLAAFMPFYIRRMRMHPSAPITTLLNLALPVSATIALGLFLDGAYKFNVAIYVAFFGLLYSISLLPAMKKHPMHAAAFSFLSRLGIIILLIVATFNVFWELDNLRLSFSVATLPVGLAFLAISIYLVSAYTDAFRRMDPFVIAVLGYPFIYGAGFLSPIAATVLGNLLVLGLGISIIRKGVLRYDIPALNFGLLIVSVLVISRFFDADISFAIRGLLFIIVGAGFFAANYLLIRKKKDHEITQ